MAFKSTTVKLTIISSLSLLTNTFVGQDIHFSQFQENPSLLNPALTGVASVLRVSTVYRDQWRGVTVPYKTYGLSIESRMKTTNWNEVEGQSMTFTQAKMNKFAGGLSVYSDKAGDGNMSTTNVNLSLATFVPLNALSKLSVGLQGSFVQHKIDFNKLVFSNQYNGTGYDASIASGENPSANSFSHPDLAAGVNWNYATQDKMIASNSQRKANLGVAVYHLTRPKQKYLTGYTPKLNMRYVLHGDFLYGVKNSNVGLAPSFLLQIQGVSTELIAGGTFKYYIKEDSKYTGIIQRTSVNFGAHFRTRDAMIVSFAYDKRQQYSIGISYDVNISALTKVSKLNGGPEITLRYNNANAFLYQKKAKVE